MSDLPKFLENRLKYHTASRVAIEEEESLSQALNLDTHTVTSQKIWTGPLSGFPVNSTTITKNTTDGIIGSMDLVNVFKNEAVSSNWYSNDLTGGSGIVWINTEYPNVRLFENVIMTPVKGSDQPANNFQAYEILSGEQRIQDWVSPMAIFDQSNSKPVPGYTVRVMAKKLTESWVNSSSSNTQDLEQIPATNWALANGTWEFIYSAGLVIFNKQYTPFKNNYPVIRMTGFQYIGEYLDNDLNEFIEGFSDYITKLEVLTRDFNSTENR